MIFRLIFFFSIHLLVIKQKVGNTYLPSSSSSSSVPSSFPSITDKLSPGFSTVMEEEEKKSFYKFIDKQYNIIARCI